MNVAVDRPFRRRVLVNTASAGLAQTWAMVVAVVTLPILLSGLGTVAFGVWALLQTLSAVNGWLSLLDVGLGTATTRQIALCEAQGDRKGTAEAMGSALALMAALALAAACLVAVIGPPVLPVLFNAPSSLVGQLRTAILLFSVQVAFDLVGGACQASIEGFQRVDLSRYVDIVRRGLVAVGTSVAALSTGRLVDVAFASTIAAGIGTVIAVLVLRRVAHGVRPRPSRAMARRIFLYGRTVALLRPLGVLHRTMDRFIVGAILGPAAVTLVEVATQIQTGTLAVMSASSYAVVPGAARLQAQKERGKLAELLKTGTRYLLLATLPVAALSVVLAGPAVNIWVGPRFSDAVPLVALAVASLVILAPAQVGSNMLLGVGQARTILRVALLSILINLVATVALVHWIGLPGAFIGTILSAAFTAPLLALPSLNHVEVDPGHFLRSAIVPALPACLAALAGAGVAVALPLSDVATLGAGALLGGSGAIVAALAVGLSAAELDLLRARLSRRR